MTILPQEIETHFPFWAKEGGDTSLFFVALGTSRNLWVWVVFIQKTAMHRLRTCAARLRPITASQTAKNLSQQRPAATPRTFQPFRCYTAPVAAEPFLNGTSSNYVEEMYYAWLENPKSVHKVRGRGHAVGWCEERLKRCLCCLVHSQTKVLGLGYLHKNAKKYPNPSIHWISICLQMLGSNLCV